MFSIELGNLTPRERANWEFALEELLDNKLIRDLGYKKELFELTKLGFDFFDENAINIKSEEIDIKSENNIKIGTVVYDNEGNNYKVIKNIDSGGCGQVFKIKRLSDNNVFALKTINNDDALETIENEMSLAIQVDSPNVVKYIYFNKNQFDLTKL